MKTWTQKYVEQVKSMDVQDIRATVFPTKKNKNMTQEQVAKQCYLALRAFLRDKKAGKLNPVGDEFRL